MTDETKEQLKQILHNDGAYDVMMETARYLVYDLAPERETVRPECWAKVPRYGA